MAKKFGGKSGRNFLYGYKSALKKYKMQFQLNQVENKKTKELM